MTPSDYSLNRQKRSCSRLHHHLGGDFNEPSHQDWTEETKDLYDHHGFVIPWTVPVLLDEAGLKDAYREFYPDVLNYPGFTYPSDNPAKPADKITWAPKADERDRIDYIWYYPEKGLKVKDAAISVRKFHSPCTAYSGNI